MLVVAAVALIGAIVVTALWRKPPPVESRAIAARLELAAGGVVVTQQGQQEQATSGTALRAGAAIETDAGARALVRLPDGSGAFLRGGSKLVVGEDEVVVERGEYWLDAPVLERKGLVHRAGPARVTAAEAGLSIAITDGGATVYVARGMAVVSTDAGRVEVNAGEQARIADGKAEVSAVAFWDDWTGGMADGAAISLGAGAGTIYGVDVGAPPGTPAQPLQIKQQSVRAVLREGLSETEVDQTFFNPGARDVEGWYWFAVPDGASVTGFAVETDGVLVEGEVIERREAAKQYGVAKSSGHAPAILEWVDGKSFRARIYPVPAAGTRRVVMRYLELRPMVDGKLSYVYPMGQSGARIGEFSLSADLGEAAAQKMDVATLDEARIEGGRYVTMRRSGFTPRVDFQLEATLKEPRRPLTVARFRTGGDAADYVMARYTPDVDWAATATPKAEVVVVVDTSADSDEASRQLKHGVAEAILRALSEDDAFALVSLDVAATVLHPKEALASASDAEIAEALEALSDHSAGGATDLAAMFDAALGRLHGAAQPAVIYVGDGVATSGELTGEQLIERMRRALSTSRARLFTVGVGANSDQLLLDELARAGGGSSHHVYTPGRASAQALELMAAVKVPTITDFELDLGAGLDEPLSNVSGKVARGSDVVVLARTHDDLPKKAVVRGRLGGEAFEREVEVHLDDSVLSAFVPRMWASSYVRRLLGGAAGPDAERGRVVALGIEYGLVTPYTSVLALESEEAYSRMGIPRRHSPLRGVRLGALDDRSEHELAMRHAPLTEVAWGCSRGEAPAQDEVAAVAPAPPPERQRTEPVPGDVAEATPVRDEEGNMAAPEAPAVAAEPSKPADPSAGDMPAPPGALDKQKKPAPLQRAAATRLATGRPGAANDPRPVDAFEGAEEQEHDQDAGKAEQKALPPVATCSDLARRPLAQRLALWAQRLRTATTPHELVARYESARLSCELSDWAAERELLRLLQAHVDSEAGARIVLGHFAARPDVQQWVARLILRRTVDERVVAAIQGVLFGRSIDWNLIDIELSEIEDVDARIARLREAMARAPDDPQGQIRLVEMLARAGRSDEALALGRRLRDRGLLTVSIARQLGDVLARGGHEQEAVRTYSEIVEFDANSLASRLLLGDIYLSHGWFEPAYRQFKTAAETSGDALAWLRLANAAAGAGRIDEALRLERRVAVAEGRPGPKDPRRWARLMSAARIGQLLFDPPEGERAPARASLERRLKELGLFATGAARLVVVTWNDLSSDVAMVAEIEERAVAAGEQIDAAPAGLCAAMLSPAEAGKVTLVARLRSPKRADPLRLVRHDIAWSGEAFEVTRSEHELSPGQTRVVLQ